MQNLLAYILYYIYKLITKIKKHLKFNFIIFKNNLYIIIIFI